MTVDGVPGSSPPSMASSTAWRISSGTWSRRRGSAPPGEVGARLQHRPPSRRSPVEPRRHPNPERCRIVPARKRKATRGVGEQHREAAGEQAAHRGAGSLAHLQQRLQRAADVEEHRRGGLSEGPALEPVEALDRAGVDGIAGEPVDRVRGKHSDSPIGETALERRRRSRARTATDDHAIVTGEVEKTVHRLKARAAQQRADGGGLVEADLQRDRRDPVEHSDQPAYHIEPVPAREQRPRGLVDRDLRGSPNAVGDVRQVGKHRVEPGLDSRQQIGLDDLNLDPHRDALARATATASALTSVATISRSGRSCPSARATAPLPVPTSTTLDPAGSVRPTSTSSSVSGRGISTRRSTASSMSRNGFRPRT